jgi:hypothetical protein
MNLDTVLDWVRNFALAKMTSEDDVFVDDFIHNMFMDNDVYEMDVSTLSGMYETLCDLASVTNRMRREVSNIAGEKILIEAIEEADRLEEE